MRLQDIMSRDIKTPPSTATVSEARSLMRTMGVHHLLVTANRAIVGIVSERDIGDPRALARGG